MKAKTVLKKLGIGKSEFEKIQQAVKSAESKTSGEIAVCLAPESSDYSVWELFYSIMISLVSSSIMLLFSKEIKTVLETANWYNPEWKLPAVFLIAVFSAIAVFFFLFNIPVLDRLIIPNEFKNKMVTDKAFETFSKSGVYATENHNGILIYVSYLEQQVRIIADEGISKRISKDIWISIADELSLNLKKADGCDAFCSAIEKCGVILSEHFPIKANDINELPDGLVIIEN